LASASTGPTSTYATVNRVCLTYLAIAVCTMTRRRSRPVIVCTGGTGRDQLAGPGRCPTHRAARAWRLLSFGSPAVVMPLTSTFPGRSSVGYPRCAPTCPHRAKGVPSEVPQTSVAPQSLRRGLAERGPVGSGEGTCRAAYGRPRADQTVYRGNCDISPGRHAGQLRVRAEYEQLRAKARGAPEGARRVPSCCPACRVSRFPTRHFEPEAELRPPAENRGPNRDRDAPRRRAGSGSAVHRSRSRAIIEMAWVAATFRVHMDR
jgi:hypothetical protein